MIRFRKWITRTNVCHSEGKPPDGAADLSLHIKTSAVLTEELREGGEKKLSDASSVKSSSRQQQRGRLGAPEGLGLLNLIKGPTAADKHKRSSERRCGGGVEEPAAATLLRFNTEISMRKLSSSFALQTHSSRTTGSHRV